MYGRAGSIEDMEYRYVGDREIETEPVPVRRDEGVGIVPAPTRPVRRAGFLSDPGTRLRPVKTITTSDWDAGAGKLRKHEQVQFSGLDLCETDLEGVEFSECVFRDGRFNCARAADVAFLNCRFVNCNFFDATFTNCKAVGSSFEGCGFDLTTIDGGDWSFIVLPRADLGSATFTGVRMREADLTAVRCRNGTMRGLDLSAAQLTGGDFTGCDLRGTDLHAFDPRTLELRDAVITADQAVVLAMALGLQIRDA
jgi:fluoroquinolone resistance protein